MGKAPARAGTSPSPPRLEFKVIRVRCKESADHLEEAATGIGIRRCHRATLYLNESLTVDLLFTLKDSSFQAFYGWSYTAIRGLNRWSI
jgi:hypothetical protein